MLLSLLRGGSRSYAMLRMEGARGGLASSGGGLSSSEVPDLAQYPGLAQPLAEAVQKKLDSTTEKYLSQPGSLAIKPDGIIFIPQNIYRRILNESFGTGGWGLVPRGPLVVADDEVRREYALFVHGHFVSQSFGEASRIGTLASVGVASESVRSTALVRCCKDLGVGAILWDPNFVSTWKANNATSAWCSNTKTGEKRLLWRVKSNPFPWPWKEDSHSASSHSSSSSFSSPSHSSSPSSSSPSSSPPSPSSPPPPPSSLFTSSRIDQTPFDPEEVMPPLFKKCAGKTWIEVLSTPDGRQYLGWAAARDPPMGPQAKRALEYWEASHTDEFEGV